MLHLITSLLSQRGTEAHRCWSETCMSLLPAALHLSQTAGSCPICTLSTLWCPGLIHHWYERSQGPLTVEVGGRDTSGEVVWSLSDLAGFPQWSNKVSWSPELPASIRRLSITDFCSGTLKSASPHIWMEWSLQCAVIILNYAAVFMFGVVYDLVCFGRMSHLLGENKCWLFLFFTSLQIGWLDKYITFPLFLFL